MDLANITVPVFMQAAREDHIATFDAVYKSLHHLGSRSKKFVLAASGHVAGVVNPPSAQKYSHWVANSTALPESKEKWLENTKELKGSWWPTWNDWLIKKAGKKIPARKPGDGQLKVLEPAPGSYVRKHSVPMN